MSGATSTIRILQIPEDTIELHLCANGLARLSQSRGSFVSGRAVNIGQYASIWLDEINSTVSGRVLRMPGTTQRLGGSDLDACMPVRHAGGSQAEVPDLLTRRLWDKCPACSGALITNIPIPSSIYETVLSPMFTALCRGQFASLCESRASGGVENQIATNAHE